MSLSVSEINFNPDIVRFSQMINFNGNAIQTQLRRALNQTNTQLVSLNSMSESIKLANLAQNSGLSEREILKGEVVKNDAISTVINAIKMLAGKLTRAIKVVGNAIATPFEALKNSGAQSSEGKKTMQNIMSVLGQGCSGLWNGIQSAGKSIFNTGVDTAKYLGNTIVNAISHPISAVKKVVVGAWNGIKNLISNIF